MEASSDGPAVGVVSSDLMVRSRLRSQLSGLGRSVVEPRSDRELEGLALLLVDLNSGLESRLELVSRAKLGRPELEVVCFGPHTEMVELHRRSAAAGADRCLANSHVSRFLARKLIGVGPGEDRDE